MRLRPDHGRFAWTALLLAAPLLLAACKGADTAGNGPAAAEPASVPIDEDPPEVVVGERLFLETRFSNYFYTESGGAVNITLGRGDPAVDVIETLDPANPLPGPMAGRAINCRQCHLVDEELNQPGGGMRAYADFARRSPVPQRDDDPLGLTHAPRNAPSMVNASLHGGVDVLLHWDGEFGSMQDLVEGTLSGRNYGWLPGEYAKAVHQVAHVVRLDNGKGPLAADYANLAYRDILACNASGVPVEFRLTDAYCINVASADDQAIFTAVSKLIAAYADNLLFSKNPNGEYKLSPYDRFLTLNDLPRRPAPGETPAEYNAALLQALNSRHDLKFVNPGEENHFEYHAGQAYIFGPRELAGLRTFLRRPQGTTLTANEAAQGGIGNCAACHAAPEFTDFRMHNTGVTQVHYDGVHGNGRFAALSIPGLATRNANPDAYLPATAAHPNASEVFRSPATADNPQAADLGVWNIFANPDFATRHDSLRRFLCAIDTGRFGNCAASDSALTDRAIAVFKTRNLRDLGDSQPYMHNGAFDDLDGVLQFYVQAGELARAGKLRNADPRMRNVGITPQDVPDLKAFLQALNEDYD